MPAGGRSAACFLLLLTLQAGSAFSQADQPAPRTEGSGLGPNVKPAPVGHRQPKASDIPKDPSRDSSDAERQRIDREIDAKLKICRNC